MCHQTSNERIRSQSRQQRKTYELPIASGAQARKLVAEMCTELHRFPVCDRWLEVG